MTTPYSTDVVNINYKSCCSFQWVIDIQIDTRNKQLMAITYEGIFVINYVVIIANEVRKMGEELQIFFFKSGTTPDGNNFRAFNIF